MFGSFRKVALFAACFGATFFLAACGGDSGSSAGDENVITADSEEDLPNCTKDREGFKAETEDGNFVCKDGVWEAEAPEVPAYDSEEDLPNCTKSREGEKIYVEESGDTLVCKSGEWTVPSKDKPESAASGDEGDGDEGDGDEEGDTPESSSSYEEWEESSSSDPVIIVDGKAVDGTCHAEPSRVGIGEQVEWVFTAGVLESTASAAQIMAYHNLVKSSRCEWTLKGSAEKSATTACKDASAGATYASAGNYSASMKVGDKTIDCGEVAVVGAPISGCLCTASETSPDVTNSSVTVTWSVSGCVSEATIDSYTWKNATGTGRTATAAFGEEGATVTPKVKVGNAENNSMTVSCQAAVAFYNHAPEAQGYTATISETAQVGSRVCDSPYGYNSVCGVTASDANGDELTYEIDGDGMFEIDPATGEITLAGQLDYESVASYTLTVTVRDGRGKSATATVEVEVTDVDEAPVFGETGYECEITEGSTSFASACGVTAIDPEGEEVTYDIIGGNTGLLFSIDPSTGAIGVTEAPEVDEDTEYDLTVSASDGLRSGSVTVHVVVLSSGSPSSSGSGEGSSASVPGGSSDASVYDADKNTLTDLRDGQVYKTTTIEVPSKNYSEVWMAENLNFETDNSYCYNDESDNCDTYGRLYTWAAAVAKSEDECGDGHTCGLGSGDIRGACPKGWHLPSQAEWEALIVAVDGSITEYTSSNTAGTKLKSATGWSSSGNGTDNFGFSALPAGRMYSRGDYYDEGYYAHFRSSTESSSNRAYLMDLNYADGSAYLGDDEDYGFSVRCLKD